MNFKSQKPHYNILVIGKTGAGKTTAINMFVNQALQRKYEDKRVIAITQTLSLDVEDKTEKFTLECNLKQFMKRQSDLMESSTKSQTRDCNMYTLESPNYTMTLIDTPGLGDTGGTSVDEQHIQKIVSKVGQMASINALLYVHRHSDCRSDIYLKYYINAFKGMLTKNCQNNIIVCYTGVVNPNKIEAKQVISEIGFSKNQYIYFENDCLTPPHLIKLNDEYERESYFTLANNYWNSNKNQFQKLITMVSGLQPKDTADIQNLYIQKSAMIKIACEKQNQIKRLDNEAVSLEQKKKSFAQVKFEVDNFGSTQKVVPKIRYKTTTRKVKRSQEVKVDEKITFCNSCQKECHNPCSLEEILSEKGHQNIKNCAAFNGSEKCTKCNCSFQVHFHTFTITKEIEEDEQSSQPYTDYVTVTDYDAIEEKNQLKADMQKLTKQISEIEQQIKTNQQDIDTELNMIVVLYERINIVAMEQTDEYTVEYLESQIKQTQKDKTITEIKKNALVKSYQSSIERYKMIKEQVQNARAKNGTVLLDNNLEQRLNQRLKQVEQELFKDQQATVQEQSSKQQPFDNFVNGPTAQSFKLY